MEGDLRNILQGVASSLGLRNYDLDLDLNPIIGDGFVGQFYAEKIKSNEGGEVTYVAVKKIPPKRNDLGVMFKNEHVFYSTIYPSLNRFQTEHSISNPFTNVPVYYCGSSEPGKEYIAMENLKPRGFVLHDKITPLDSKHLEHVFKVYGRFHALSFIFERENPNELREMLNEIKPIYETYSKEDIASPIRSSFAGAVNALDPENEGEFLETCSKLINDIGSHFLKATLYNGKYSCINHGDCWSNNILFAYDASGIQDVKLLDFQLCRKTTPVHDLSYLFYSGGSEEAFNNVSTYLKIYHDSFSEFANDFGYKGEDLYPYKNLVAEWKENSLYGNLMAIYVWPYKLYRKEDVAKILGDEHLTGDQKHAKWKILQHEIYQSEVFKKATKILLRHLIDNLSHFLSR